MNVETGNEAAQFHLGIHKLDLLCSGGGREAKYDHEKAWPSTYHSILSLG
jgi:hypothetical protein